MSVERESKNTCPCCGRREGVLLVHGSLTDPEAFRLARSGALVRAGHSRLPSAYRLLLNRQCLRCEFAWRVRETPENS